MKGPNSIHKILYYYINFIYYAIIIETQTAELLYNK